MIVKVLIAAVVVIGCGSKDSPPQAGSGSVVAPPKPVAVVVDAAPPVDASVLGDLPPLALADIDKPPIDASTKLTAEGYAAVVKKDLAGATAKFVEAVKIDPGNLLARYNLASAYSKTGDEAKAFALLAQFKLPDCRACAGILLHAKTDADWKSRTSDDRFKAIIDGVTAEKADLKQLTKLVILAVRKGKTDGLQPFIHPRAPLTVEVLGYGRKTTPRLIYGWAGFVDFVGKGDKSIEDNGIRECDKACCYTGQRGDSSDVVSNVCFAGVGGVLFISRIDFDPGPI